MIQSTFTAIISSISWYIRSKQPESLLVLHGSVIPSQSDGGRNSITDQINAWQNSGSNTNTLERKQQSTPNNTASVTNPIQVQPPLEATVKRPKVVMSCSSTLERPNKMFVHRSVELLQEQGIEDSITGRNRISSPLENGSKLATSFHSKPIKTAQNAYDSDPEVRTNVLNYLRHRILFRI